MHDSFTTRLSDYLDDEAISREERDEIAAHLAECASCQATFEELRMVVARARALPDSAPASDLWPGVAERVDARAPVGARPRTERRRFSFTLPQLAAASLALMVLSGSLVWMARIGGTRTELPPVTAGGLQMTPVNFADPHYDQAIADLEKALHTGRGRLDSETVRVLEQNLLVIDRAIEQSRRALSADPANLFLNSHLAEARKRKLTLLRRVTAQLDLEG
jgi:hypothetical protein